MDAKILTEAAWKALAQKSKIKDTTVQKALFLYEQFEDEEYGDRLKALMALTNFAVKAKAIPDIKCLPVLVKYLGDMIAAAQAEQREIVKAKAATEKAELADAKAEAAQAKVKALEAKAEAEEAKRADEENEEGEDEEEGDYAAKLKKALNSLKSAKEPYHSLVCVAKPHCGLALSKQLIGAEQRAELTTVTGGGKTFLKPGRCQRDGSTLIFDMENAPSGLAVKLMQALKHFTGIKFKVMVGEEAADGEESEQAAAIATATAAAAGEAAEVGAAKAAAPLPQVSPKLAKAPETWRATQASIATGIKQLQGAVRKALAGESPAVLAQIEANVAALDGITNVLGKDLPEILAQAADAKDLATRNAALKSARTLVADCIKYVKGPGAGLIAHLDTNPFGVKPNIKKTLGEGLRKMAGAIGSPA